MNIDKIVKLWVKHCREWPDGEQAMSYGRFLAALSEAEGEREQRVRYAFDLIARANTVSILSLGEMESVVNRALSGEFEDDLAPPKEKP